MNSQLISQSAFCAAIFFSLTWSYSHEIHDERGENLPDYEERLARALAMEPHKLQEGLRQRALAKIERTALEGQGMLTPRFAFPYTANPELKAHGTVKTLTVLIDFKDHLAESSNLPTREDFHHNIYGLGTTEGRQFTPFESVHEYYRRASEGLSDLQGNVLDWHHFAHDRAHYQSPTAQVGPNKAARQAYLDNQALFAIAKEVLNTNDATHDFAQYDNDHDGDIDLLTILYAGPRGAWSSFWWAYRWEFQVPQALQTRFDGKRLKQFVFQFIDTRGAAGNDFDPQTLLHEMGHAYGLTDYYDYDPSIGPPGGIGGLDMMHANIGNHCAFSRWLLDWIKPTIIGMGSPGTRTLRPSSETYDVSVPPVAPNDKAIAIFPGLGNATAPGSEMFIIENRQPIGNDVALPGGGLVCWHIDASPNPSLDDFRSDNSTTPHKLIRLVRADNTSDFLHNEAATALSFFQSGTEFSNSSTPSSVGISGTPSYVAFRNISVQGYNISLDIGIEGPEPPGFAANAAIEIKDPPKGNAELELIAKAATDQNIDTQLLDRLDRQLQSASPQGIAQIWNITSTVSIPPTSQSRLSQRMILSQWALKDGQAAIHALLASNDSSFIAENFPTVLNAWANNDPLAAGEWYLASSQQEIRANSALAVGAKFAEKIFCCLSAQSQEMSIASLDKIDQSEALQGAVMGIEKASAMTTITVVDLSPHFAKLGRNRDVVLSTGKLIKLQAQGKELEQKFLIETAELIKEIRKFEIERGGKR